MSSAHPLAHPNSNSGTARRRSPLFNKESATQQGVSLSTKGPLLNKCRPGPWTRPPTVSFLSPNENSEFKSCATLLLELPTLPFEAWLTRHRIADSHNAYASRCRLTFFVQLNTCETTYHFKDSRKPDCSGFFFELALFDIQFDRFTLILGNPHFTAPRVILVPGDLRLPS